MIQVIELIIKALVEDEKSVKLGVQEDGENVTVSVHVAERDMGRVIGKAGATVTAIRTILKNCNSKDGKRYFIQIGDKKEGGAPHGDRNEGGHGGRNDSHGGRKY
jgi:predicted RNA-binding protein YlqC (UPF0109 family)